MTPLRNSVSPRDDFKASVANAADQAGAAAPAVPAPPSCVYLLRDGYCDRPATNGDLCDAHFEKTADIRAEYEELSAAFEDER